MIQSSVCNICASVLHPCWVSAINASSFATQSGKIGALGLKDREFGNSQPFGFQIRAGSCQVKEKLKFLPTSPCALGMHTALHPLAESAIAFTSKAKLTLVPPAFPAELERKSGLLQKQNVVLEEICLPSIF